MILAIFLFLGAFFIVSNENLHLSNKAEAKTFGSLYYNWFLDLFSNVHGVVGYAVKSEWLPDSNLSR